MNELPSSAFGVVRQFPETKEGVEIFSRQLIQAVENGDVNALELKAYFKAIEAIIERVDKSTKEGQLNEAQKYSEKKFRAFGMQVEVAEVGTKYDYTHCQDIAWEMFSVAENTAANRRREREAFLKTLKEPITLVNEDTGEVYKVLPPIKRSTTGLKFTL